MRRLICKATRRDEQEQTTPSAPLASAAREAAAGEPVNRPPPIPFSHGVPPLLPGPGAAPNPIFFVRHPALIIFYANLATEATLAVSCRQLVEMSLYELFVDPSGLVEVITTVATRQLDAKRRDVSFDRLSHEPLHAYAVMGVLNFAPASVLLELLPNEQKIRSEREERLLNLTSANKKLIRNLTHEIKNPLGGIRGATQLLGFELPERSLRRYMQVIIRESDRLQTLADRLLGPHRRPHIVDGANIREALERVHSVVLVEFPQGSHIVRDYDTSPPEFRGDKEQFVQAMLNVVHSAVHAPDIRIAQGDGEIILHTRAARRITTAKHLYKLASDLYVVDNGSGTPDDVHERIFFPLVSGRGGREWAGSDTRADVHIAAWRPD